MKLIVRYAFARICLTLLALLTVGLTALDSPAAGQEAKKVFVLHSYHQGYTSTDNVTHGIDGVFKQSGIKIEIYVNYLDAKRVQPTPQYFSQFKDLLRERYKGVRFDAVLTGDNDALEFMRKHRDELFPGVPVVFCGVNDFDERMLDGRRDLTGIIERSDYAGTIRSALKLRPATKNIVVVTDNTTTGRAHRSAVEKIRPDFPQGLSLRYLSLADMTLDELVQALSTLNHDSIVLLLHQFVDRNGTNHMIQESTPRITKSASVPVFTVNDSTMGLGVLGGHLISGYSQGEAAARMAVKILGGTDVGSIPVLLDSPNRYIFDYRVMERFGIAEGDLPRGCILINKPASLLEEHRPLLFVILGTFIVLSGILVYLLFEIRRRKRSEEALRASEEKYRNIFENVQDVFYEVTIGGLILDVSPSIADVSNGQYRREDIIGKSLFEFYAKPEEREAFLEVMQKRGRVTDYEITLKNRDGTMVPCAISAKMQYDEQGKPAKITGSVRDNSERKRAEQALRESEERFRLAFHTNPDAININRLHDGLYVDINEGFTRLTGFTREESIGKTSLEIDIWCRMEDRQELVRGLRDKGYYENLEADFRRKDGSSATGLMSAQIIVLKGVQHILSITRDISEIKRVEQEKESLEVQLRQAQKMEAIGTLAGGIAHDFNNILSAVFGFAELAKLKIEDRKYIEKALNEILKAGIRARDLVRQILTFSRQTSINKEPMALVPLIQEALKFLRASLPVTIHINQDLAVSDSMIIADPIHIHQIIMNLCTNAAYAMREKGGVLNIHLGEVELDDDEPDSKGLKGGRYLQLTVADTGSGIPKEIISKIFDPFFTTKERGEGTGMGLSVVHGIVKDLGGAVSVYSEPGKGTTFHILFPKYEGKAPLADSSDRSLKVGNARILFVDDEEGIIRSGCEILGQLGYSVVSTTSPLEALEIFRSGPHEFNLVLTDMTMPHMTGLELAEQLLMIRSDIRIVLSTGFSMGITADIIKSAGITDLVMKPMIASELANVVSSALNPDPL